MIIIILGMLMLGYGFHLRLGGSKTWYLTRGSPIIVPVAVQHMLIPLGITLLGMDIMYVRLRSAPDSVQSVFDMIVISMLLMSLVLGVWPPRWLRPRWLVYLEDEYGSVMWHLLEEARKNAGVWEQRVSTQKGLEEWAEETRKQLGYPPHPGQIEREAKKRQEPPA